MDPVEKEAMAVVIELKRIVSLRLCNEIASEDYECRRERLLNDFNLISARLMHFDEMEAVF